MDSVLAVPAAKTHVMGAPPRLGGHSVQPGCVGVGWAHLHCSSPVVVPTWCKNRAGGTARQPALAVLV